MMKYLLTSILILASTIAFSQSILKGEVINENGEKVTNFSISELNTNNRAQVGKDKNTFVFLLNNSSGFLVIEHKEYQTEIIAFDEVLNIKYLRKIKLKFKNNSLELISN